MGGRFGKQQRRPHPRPALTRVPTDVPGLDRVLDGGLLGRGMHLLAGEPGTGKTLLANQIAFNHVARGGRVAYITLLTESHARMVAQLANLGFYDSAVVGRGLWYVSGFRTVGEEGLDGLSHLVESEVRRRRATLVVLDGTSALEEASPSAPALRHFLQRLRSLLEVAGCTALLCIPETSGGNAPLFTTADGVFLLAYSRVGMRAPREFFVGKLRGSRHLEGAHMFEIDESGVVIHPRTEAALASPTRLPGVSRTRQPFGIAALDEMLRGGLFSGSTTALAGARGSGKTLLALQFLAQGGHQRERGLYFGFYEAPERLVAQAEAIGMPASRLREQGLLDVVWTRPYETLLDAVVERLLDHVHRRGIRRLFVDGVDALHEGAVYPGRIAGVLAALTNELRALEVTTMMSLETTFIGTDLSAVAPISAYVENQILLRFVEFRSRLYRFLSILKMRGSDYDAALREFTISSRGIEIASTFESAEAVLSGIARETGAAGFYGAAVRGERE